MPAVPKMFHFIPFFQFSAPLAPTNVSSRRKSPPVWLVPPIRALKLKVSKGQFFQSDVDEIKEHLDEELGKYWDAAQ